MRRTVYLLAACFVFSGLLLSCGKSYNDTPTYSSMEDVFAQLSVQPQIDTIDATAGATFYGASGTRYIFAPNSFQTASGVAVTGKVQIRSLEYLDKGDMIFSKMLPISNKEPLLSGGEINVSATQNGKPIYLKPNTTFQANMPMTGANPAGMSFFSGQPSNDTTQFRANWVPIQPDTNKHGAVGISPWGTDTLGIISDSLEMCNADRFMTAPDFQTFTVTVQVNGGTLSTSSRVYGYTFYDTYKGVWPLGCIGSYSNGVFNEMHVPDIPVHFAVFTLINGKFYGGTGSATPVTGSNYTVTISQVDAAAFKKQVSAL